MLHDSVLLSSRSNLRQAQPGTSYPRVTDSGITDRDPYPNSGLVVHGRDDLVHDELMHHDNPMLQQKMKPRHLQMIAVGGSIGTGLFVGSGRSLAAGGPAGILVAWILIGCMLINVTQASTSLSDSSELVLTCWISPGSR